jgi:NDP-sugar pyrophosphorylase family protein
MKNIHKDYHEIYVDHNLHNNSITVEFSNGKKNLIIDLSPSNANRLITGLKRAKKSYDNHEYFLFMNSN